jgi:nicotinate-nucleotide adenylyltransferase
MAPTEPEAGVPEPRRRVGLFGGSFDPVHAGHLHAARAARDRFGLDRVVFVPAGRSPFKAGREPAPAQDRLRMLELAIAPERGFEVSRIELDRPGPSYTLDTLRALPAALGEREACELYLILGSDQLAGLPGWRGVREILALAQPIVVHRAGDPEASFEALRRALGPELAARVERGYLRLPPVEASSTGLREALAQALPQLGAAGLALPAAVLEHIRARGLYGARR